MGVIHIQLPDEISELIDRQVAAGWASSKSEFLIEAARRYSEDLSLGLSPKWWSQPPPTRCKCRARTAIPEIRRSSGWRATRGCSPFA